MRAKPLLWLLVASGAFSAFALSIEGPPETVMQRGLRQYQQHCVMCHQQSGTGIERQVAALPGSRLVTGSPKPLIEFLHRGSKASQGYQRSQYSMVCYPQPERVISDQNLAAVLTYIRASWGNKAPEVTPQMVRIVRSESHK